VVGARFPSFISLPPSISLHFIAKREKKNQLFCLYVIFLLQAYVSIFQWWANKAYFLPQPN